MITAISFLYTLFGKTLDGILDVIDVRAHGVGAIDNKADLLTSTTHLVLVRLLVDPILDVYFVLSLVEIEGLFAALVIS